MKFTVNKLCFLFAAKLVMISASSLSYAADGRAMEDVIKVRAEAANLLLGDDVRGMGEMPSEEVVLISSVAAAQLLGDDNGEIAFNPNALPATAAGDGIIYHDVEATRALLGD